MPSKPGQPFVSPHSTSLPLVGNNMQPAFLSKTDILSRVHYEKARTLFLSGKTEKSLIEIKKSLKLNPKNYSALILMGNIQGELENPQKTMSYLNKAIKLAPNNPDAYATKASELLSLKRSKSAAKICALAYPLIKRDYGEYPFDLFYDTFVRSLFDSGEIKKGKKILMEGIKKIGLKKLKHLCRQYNYRPRIFP